MGVLRRWHLASGRRGGGESLDLLGQSHGRNHHDPAWVDAWAKQRVDAASRRRAEKGGFWRGGLQKWVWDEDM